MISLKIHGYVRRIRPDDAPLDLPELMDLFYAVNVLNGCGLSVSAAKRCCARWPIERDYGDWIWRGAVEAFAKQGRLVCA
jgi:hypothetical protein